MEKRIRKKEDKGCVAEPLGLGFLFGILLSLIKDFVKSYI
jgi:hypothetical protein